MSVVVSDLNQDLFCFENTYFCCDGVNAIQPSKINVLTPKKTRKIFFLDSMFFLNIILWKLTLT